jgi:hypothetical protein
MQGRHVRAQLDIRGHCDGVCGEEKGERAREGQRDGETGRVRAETSADRGGLRSWQPLRISVSPYFYTRLFYFILLEIFQNTGEVESISMLQKPRISTSHYHVIRKRDPIRQEPGTRYDRDFTPSRHGTSWTEPGKPISHVATCNKK